MIGQLNLTLWAWIESFRSLRRGAVWPPLLLLAAVNCVGLLFLTEFHRPVLAWFMAPLLRAVGGSASLHYPNFYLGLPGFFSIINVATDLLVGAWVFGTIWLIGWKLATGVDTRGSRAEATRFYAKLVVLRLPISLLPLILSLLLPRILPARADGTFSPMTQRLERGVMFALAVLIESAFLFGPAALLLGRRTVKGAFADTFKMLGRAPLAIILVVFGPNCLNLVVDYVVRHRETVVLKLAPEAVVVIVLAAIAVYIFAAYLVIGAGVRIWGARGIRSEGGGA